MSVLADRVQISRRFRRSVRIDSDLFDPTALTGFVCPRSSALVLETMAQHVQKTGQAAFTWTGPYGSGKSSLVVALSAVLNGDAELRNSTARMLGYQTAEAVWTALPTQAKGWRILPVVGRRDRPAQVVGEAIERARFIRNGADSPWSDEAVYDVLLRVARRNPRTFGGLVVFLDEMGKLLEGAAYEDTDIYFFQQLAEIASRSNNRLIVVGILHQAFEEYANRLSREVRDEWAKVQGRFIDLPINVGPDEQLELLGRAIESDEVPRKDTPLFKEVAALGHHTQTSEVLRRCWPLHPIVACLLGPISRRSFGQNQRSIFGFLNSTEPFGFQDFLGTATEYDLYMPELLWDYLRANLEPSIMASSDGHRWAMAVDALERSNGSSGDELEIRLLKTIGLVDLFRERSGLVPSLELLILALRDQSTSAIQMALSKLMDSSLVIHRKFSNGYSIFEGSDFDIRRAVDEAFGEIDRIDHIRLSDLAGLQPVIAKRHYHETGAIRWFDTTVVPLRDLEEVAGARDLSNGAMGSFFLALPTPGESPETVERIAKLTVIGAEDGGIIVGIPRRSTWTITTLARELLALEHVRDNTPELRGDRVGRREVEDSIADLQSKIEVELDRAFENAQWHGKELRSKRLDHTEINSLVSDFADERFKKAPKLNNELLNRIRPSSNAIAAQNALLRRMALCEGKPRLGIEDFPAEGGLFASLLHASGLYQNTPDGLRFIPPEHGDDPCNLVPAWEAATEFLEAESHRSVSIVEIYDLWRRAPFGIKDGLLPILALAFTLSKRDVLAFYRQGIFQAFFTDLDAEVLAKNPTDIQVRWMDLSAVARRLLADMADIVRDLDAENTLPNLEPIDVARGLVAIYDRLPPWVGRTQRLSSKAKRIRQLLKQANDPNRLIFDDLPQVLDDSSVIIAEIDTDEIAARIRAGLTELCQAFPTMLNRIREMLLAELQVPNASSSMLAELRARSANIRDLGGDHRLEAFVVRVAQFEGSEEDVEGLAGMAVNKPPRDWVDADIDRASIELATLAQRFIRAEAFARVKGRKDKRHAMAVVVGMEGKPNLVHNEFETTDRDQSAVRELIERLDGTLKGNGHERHNVILAALAELSARYLDSGNSAKPGEGRRSNK